MRFAIVIIAKIPRGWRVVYTPGMRRINPYKNPHPTLKKREIGAVLPTLFGISIPGTGSNCSIRESLS